MQTFYQLHSKRFFGSKKKSLNTVYLIASGILVFILVSLLGVGILLAWYAKDLPRPDKVKRTEGLSTVILDKNGRDIYQIFEDENRIPLAFEDIPEYCKDATISIEDKDFYKHPGLSRAGIFRALVQIAVFRNFQGGSTLTQQLVKTVLLSKERTIPRKIKEAILAVQIERKYTKDEILQMYLNEVPFGGTAIGLESAAQSYFGKDAKNLGLLECAVLAGFPQSPSRYSPFTGEKDAYIWRSEQVLRRMREDGHISSSQEEEAKKKLPDMVFSGGATSLIAPHFIAYVKDQLIDLLGADAVTKGGLTVTTTLDLDIQTLAQTTVYDEVEKAKKLKVSNGAAVVLDTANGQILAMVGSKDYEASDTGGFKFNVATQGLRQPGSTIKPISYATAFKKGFTPATLLMDVETKYPSGDSKKPEYNPKNYDGKYRGPLLLRYALGNSINTLAVKLTALVGIRDILKTAYEMGLSTLEPTQETLNRLGLSMTLGGGEVTLLELTGAFGVFSQAGQKRDTVSILKVEDVKNKVLYEYKPQKPNQVLDEDVSYLISHILSDNDARKEVFGAKSLLVIPGKTVAVKTGTTDDKRDNWTVGYSTTRAVGVWVGNNDNSPMHPSLSSGITGAAPIWNKIMKQVLSDLPNEPFKRPDSIIEFEIDGYGGGLPVDGQPKRTELFIKGTEPSTVSTIYKSIKLSRRDNKKLANDIEVNKGDYDSKQYIIFSETDPISTDGKNRWQEGIDSWIAAQGDERFHPPTEYFTEGDKVSVRIFRPGDGSRIDSNNFEVVAEGASLASDISKIEIYIDGNKVKETSGREFRDNISVSNGSHKLRVKAYDRDGNTSEREIGIGVNEAYATPTQVPQPTNTPAPPTDTPIPTP